MAKDGAIELYISNSILDEILRVEQDKFRESPERLEDIRRLITSFTKHVAPLQTLDVVRDPDDNKILECALAAKADYLITGDKDLLDLKQFRGVRICD